MRHGLEENIERDRDRGRGREKDMCVYIYVLPVYIYICYTYMYIYIHTCMYMDLYVEFLKFLRRNKKTTNNPIFQMGKILE